MSHVYVESSSENTWSVAKSWEEKIIRKSKIPRTLIADGEKYLILNEEDFTLIKENFSKMSCKEAVVNESLKDLEFVLQDLLKYLKKLPIDLDGDNDDDFLETTTEILFNYVSQVYFIVSTEDYRYADCGYENIVDLFKQIIKDMNLRKYLVHSCYYYLAFVNYYIDVSEHINFIESEQNGVIVNLSTGLLLNYVVTNVSHKDLDKYYNLQDLSTPLSQTERDRLSALFC